MPIAQRLAPKRLERTTINERLQVSESMRWLRDMGLGDVDDLTAVVQLGFKDKGVAFHRHGPSYHAQLHGHKLWWMGSPGVLLDKDIATFRDKMFHEKEGHDNAACTMPPPSLRSRLEWCVLRPGDILLLPDKWWHQTCSLDARTFALGFITGGTKAGKRRPTVRTGCADSHEDCSKVNPRTCQKNTYLQKLCCKQCHNRREL
jgi:hypothetical protein